MSEENGITKERVSKYYDEHPGACYSEVAENVSTILDEDGVKNNPVVYNACLDGLVVAVKNISAFSFKKEDIIISLNNLFSRERLRMKLSDATPNQVLEYLIYLRILELKYRIRTRKKASIVFKESLDKLELKNEWIEFTEKRDDIVNCNNLGALEEMLLEYNGGNLEGEE